MLSALIAWHTFMEGPIAPVERAFEWSPLGGGFVFELGMLVDGLTAMMFLLVTLVSLMVQIYSREYMAGEPRFTYFFAMLSLFTFSMLLLVIANNMLQAVVGWELVGLCSYLLIGFYWEEKSNQDAANKAFLTTKFADVGILVGVIVLSSGMLAQTDTPFNILQTIDAAVAGDLATGTLVLGTLLIFLGAVGKSGQMPLHVWLPDAMAGPTPVSALIHAATMVTAGVFLVARLFPVYAQSLAIMNVVAVIGVIIGVMFLITVVGVVEKGMDLGPQLVREDDVVIGLRSPNLRSNGFSLVRSVFGDEIDAHIDALLEPSVVYSPSVLAAVATGGVHAAAHITGGGIVGNLARALPEGMGASVDTGSWQVPPVFDLVASHGVSKAEMFRTFNMGIGFCLVTDPAQAETVLSAVEAHDPVPIAHVRRGNGVSLR